MSTTRDDARTVDTLDTIHAELRDYARRLMAAGFTVYASPTAQWPLEFFHYSRSFEDSTGQRSRNYGIAEMPNFPRLGEPIDHSMPIKPSRENGSGIRVRVTPADLDPASVEYAEQVTRPTNRSAVRGQLGEFRNAEPWGIGTHYFRVELHADADADADAEAADVEAADACECSDPFTASLTGHGHACPLYDGEATR